MNIPFVSFLPLEHELDAEVLLAIKHGCTPDEALQEWDLYPYKEE